ncbi:C25 family cysteine peptidase [Hallella sp.]|uniref:C25 family cysteine peptidase n=3 Tax=Hallella sp. TaxID=2980186 RepID=UPI00307A2C7A
MKRLLLIIVSAFGVLLTQAQQVLDLQTGSLTDGVGPTVPTRDVVTLPGGYRVTYTFKNALLQADDLFKGTIFWKVDGFGLNPLSGDPSTLMRNDMLAVPEGYVATAEVTDSAYRDFPYELTPARQPLIDSGDEVYTLENVQSIAPYEGYKPQAIVTQEPTQSYRGYDLCLVDVSPIQYSYADKTVRAYTSITYKVTFVPKVKEDAVGSESAPKYVSPDDYFFSNNVIGGEQPGEADAKSTTQDAAAKADVKDYLIVSTPKFEEAVNRFAEWKRLMGFNVHVDLRDDWTTYSVRTTVKTAFYELPALYYLLIVGDQADVPAWKSPLRISHVTDFYYGCMDDDLVPDIYCGRLPVSTMDEANIVVDKIVGYEKDPPSNPSFYRDGLHCSYFEDRKGDTYADRRFAQTSEDILTYVKTKGKNLQRVYTTPSNVTPLFWNNGVFSWGEPVPEELKKPNFAWDGKASDITDAINKGMFYVFHRDHGEIGEWSWPKYTQQDISSLSNGNLLPVVFSINCHSGQFDADCFAETFLRKPNGGCVAIFAASQSSYSGQNDALATGMFDAIWPDPGLSIRIPDKDSVFSATPSPTYTLGQILNQGKVRMTETYGVYDQKAIYTDEIYHCFGDPSMMLYTDVPSSFPNAVVDRSSNKISISLGAQETARITAYNPLTGEMQSYLGNSAVVQTPNPDETIICVSAHNRVPFIQYPDVKYLQNEQITGELKETHDVIKVGNHVTDLKAIGDVTTSNADITLKARKVLLDKGTYISKGSKLKIN